MEDLGLSTGLAALAFWGFVAAAVLGSYWDGIRKRETQHETIRRAIESGQPLDDEMLDKLTTLNARGSGRADRDFRVTALWILPVAAGMVVFAFFMGFIEPQARTVMLGVAGLLATLGIGFFLAAKYTERWYR